MSDYRPDNIPKSYVYFTMFYDCRTEESNSYDWGPQSNRSM